MSQQILRGLFLVAFVAALAVLIGPILQASGDVNAGQAVYVEHCQKCHGEKGKGDGPSAKKLKLKMADYTNAAKMAKMTDAELIKITSEGGAAVGKSKLMTPFNDKLTPQQIADVVAYVRTFVPKKT